jgi:hypothetical protein
VRRRGRLCPVTRRAGAALRARPDQTGPVAPPERSEHVLLVLLWGLPVLATAAFLLLVDLPVLAAGLLAVEVVVGAMVVAARRSPD